MNVQNETSIRALQKYKKVELQKILDEYHRKCREVDERIEEIREERGTKIKPKSWDAPIYNPHVGPRGPMG